MLKGTKDEVLTRNGWFRTVFIDEAPDGAMIDGSRQTRKEQAWRRPP
jgi:hypothetical protein